MTRLARGLGRLLCFVGWHRWSARSQYTRTAVLTFNHCTREGCPYAEEMLINLERRDPSCTCRRHATSLFCPVHGRDDAFQVAAGFQVPPEVLG